MVEITFWFLIHCEKKTKTCISFNSSFFILPHLVVRWGLVSFTMQRPMSRSIPHNLHFLTSGTLVLLKGLDWLALRAQVGIHRWWWENCVLRVLCSLNSLKQKSNNLILFFAGGRVHFLSVVNHKICPKKNYIFKNVLSNVKENFLNKDWLPPFMYWDWSITIWSWLPTVLIFRTAISVLHQFVSKSKFNHL